MSDEQSNNEQPEVKQVPQEEQAKTEDAPLFATPGIPPDIQASIDQAILSVGNPNTSVDIKVEAGKLRSWHRQAIWRACRHAYLDYPNDRDAYLRAVIENAKLDPIISAIIIEVILFFARKWLEKWLNGQLSATDLQIFPDVTAFAIES